MERLLALFAPPTIISSLFGPITSIAKPMFGLFRSRTGKSFFGLPGTTTLNPPTKSATFNSLIVPLSSTSIVVSTAAKGSVLIANNP